MSKNIEKQNFSEFKIKTSYSNKKMETVESYYCEDQMNPK